MTRDTDASGRYFSDGLRGGKKQTGHQCCGVGLFHAALWTTQWIHTGFDHRGKGQVPQRETMCREERGLRFCFLKASGIAEKSGDGRLEGKPQHHPNGGKEAPPETEGGGKKHSTTRDIKKHPQKEKRSQHEQKIEKHENPINVREELKNKHTSRESRQRTNSKVTRFVHDTDNSHVSMG